MTPSITDQAVFTALRTFLIAILPSGTEVVQAQDNLVGMPEGGFVSMNNISKVRLATNTHSYTRNEDLITGTRSIQDRVQFTMQVDFYGPNSGEWAVMAQTLLRDEYGISLFPSNIVPLYSDDPIQIPLIDGEMNYTQRWKLRAVMQYNPVVTVTQQYAIELEATTIQADEHIIQ